MATAKQMDFLLVGLHKGDGTINSSGVVTFFESGTSTPKNAFDGPDTVADNSITSIALDATGKAVVFGNGTYRIVIKDSDGNTIGTYDGMSYTIPTTTLNDVQSITNGDSPFTITTSMHTIQCNATGGAITVTLPTAVGISGQQFYIKKTDSSANAVTIGTNGAQTIDGAASFSLASQYDWLLIESDGSNWSIQSELDAVFNTDTISEKTAAAEVSFPDDIKVAEVHEIGAGDGVIVDSCTIKDGGVEAVTDQNGGPNILLKAIPIGPWDMGTDGQINVAHGLTFSKIRPPFGAMIVIDSGATYYPLKRSTSAANVDPLGGVTSIDSTNIVLVRLDSSFFDSANFNLTSVNIDNDAAVDKGSGLVGIPITAHTFNPGDATTLAGTTNYDASYVIVSKTANEIVITATFVAETFAGGGAETASFSRGWVTVWYVE